MVRMDGPAGRTGASQAGATAGGLSNLGLRIASSHKKLASAVGWSAAGDKLFVAGDASTIRVYDAERLSSRDPAVDRDAALFSGHSADIEHVVAAPHSPNLFATTGIDGLVNLYDMRAGEKPRSSIKLERQVLYLRWSEDGAVVLAGTSCNSLYVIDAKSWSVKAEKHRDIEVNEFAWHRSGKFLLLALGDGRVEVCEWPSLKTMQHLPGHRARCYGIAVDPTGRRFAVSSEDHVISTWNAATLNCDFTIDRSGSAVRVLAYSHDGRYLASGSSGGGIDVTAADTGARVTSLDTQGLTVRHLKWHPHRLLLAYCGDPDNQRQVAPQPMARMYPNAPPPPPPRARAYVYGYPIVGSNRVPR